MLIQQVLVVRGQALLEIIFHGHASITTGADADIILMGNQYGYRQFAFALATFGKTDKPVEALIVGPVVNGASLAADLRL